jgi:hypothetical protein
MLTGFSGHLLSEYFLETSLPIHAPEAVAYQGPRARTQVGRWRRSCASLGPASSLNTILETGVSPLLGLLGFGPVEGLERTPSALVGSLAAGTRPVLLVVATWGAGLDGIWRLAVVEALRRRAAWSLAFNGTHVRIVDVSRSYARRFLQIDLELVSDDERALDAFQVLAHASALATDAVGNSRLGVMVDRSQHDAAGVSRALREGVLSASTEVADALLSGRKSGRALPSLDGLFEQALTIVYRILFLLFAEARGLVPLWHPVYRDTYSFDSLRMEAERRPQAVTGLWDALRAVTHLAHTGCDAGDLKVTAFNGRLFAPERTPLAERHDLDDGAGTRALLALTTRPAADGAGLERITYRDLGVEQLGSVYETLLDYEPVAQPSAQSARCGRIGVTLKRGSGARKTSGSFYTPQPIADYLVRRVLGPLVYDSTPEQILQLRVLDPSMGSGAFLVASCLYLCEAYEAALIRTGGCRPDDFGEQERSAARRRIAERCLYGVDINPMAVQLGRLSLWLATLAADRPLTFLDHHLHSGDSLLGAWLSNLKRAPRVRRRKPHRTSDPLPFPEDSVSDALRAALPIRHRLETGPDDSAEDVRVKEQALAALSRHETLISKWKRVADVWCAPWFADGDRAVPADAFPDLSDAILLGSGSLPGRTVDRWLQSSDAIARTRRLFHWELEFPEVFFGRDGRRLPNAGFDAVLGNPPWDMVRADWGSNDERVRSRNGIEQLLRFTRDSGVYEAQSAGHANRYQLFLERSMALVRHGGRIGLVLPSGLATDHGSAGLRRRLFADCNVDALVGIDNQRGIFPIHRSLRFLLLTASRGSPTTAISCRFGVQDPSCLEEVGEESAERSGWYSVQLSPDLIRRVSGSGLTIPDFRDPLDLAIAERAAALFPPFGSERGWNARFGRELNASDDRAHFITPAMSALPVVEGKQIQPFQADLRAARYGINQRAASRLVDPGRFGRARLAYRDVASATNRLTLIAAVLPAGCVSTHTLWCLRTPLPRRSLDFLCGLLNSLVLNFLVRLRVTTHVATEIVESLPVPREHQAPGAAREIAALARLLSRTSGFEHWVRLQSIVAHLYQLTAPELDRVLETFPLIPAADRDAVRSLYADGP